MAVVGVLQQKEEKIAMILINFNKDMWEVWALICWNSEEVIDNQTTCRELNRNFGSDCKSLMTLNRATSRFTDIHNNIYRPLSHDAKASRRCQSLCSIQTVWELNQGQNRLLNQAKVVVSCATNLRLEQEQITPS